ncbi:MBOAT-domain-containing protein [Aulographum hederae CBS 113979]|uniref:MBOAT-domain-containing protein n=1 Tax=Aulographum hederae CBS 113979 TaxID=1176131 RepID=A0A6G1GRN3_9PEZI|nr:MBOAT-domain-containing protein [Aulographum hederae CBS 113979]
MLPYIDSPFIYVADKLGASSDELKLIFSFLLSYPLAAALKRIPDSKPAQKNLFIVGISIFYLIGLFDLWYGLRTLLISAGGAYGIAMFVEGPYMPWIAFVFLMGHMSISHLDRQFIDLPSSVDVSGAQMVLVMKLTAFCWNIHDGKLPDSDLTDFQKERAIRQLPSLLDYAGYVFFFPSLFAGPAFDYEEYTRYISTSMFNLPPGTDPSKAPATRKKRRIPRSGKPAALKAAMGLAWIFAFLKLSAGYAPEMILGPDYMKYGLFRRIWLMYMLGLVTRMKYYGVWSLTEGACILSGIGYKGIDPATGRASWDRLQNVKPLGIELAQNSHEYLGNWNINTNAWLRNYMYLRVTPKGKKPGFYATMATFITSAFWHGFYPGYYMAFIMGALLQTISKNARRLLRPLFLPPPQSPLEKPTTTLSPGKLSPTSSSKQPPNVETPRTNTKLFYDIVSWFLTQASFAFTVMPFILLTLHKTMTAWARVYFFALVGVAVCFAFLNSPGKAVLQKRVAKHTSAAERPGFKREGSTTSVKDRDQEGSMGRTGGMTLGVPDDPEREVQEIVEEVKREIERRKKMGETVPDLGKMVEERLGNKRD